jgi:hypothetical protein
MPVRRVNIIRVRRHDRLLRLHYLNVIRHARREAVPRLGQRLVRQFHVSLSYRYLIRRRTQIQQRRPNLLIDLTLQIRPPLKMGTFNALATLKILCDSVKYEPASPKLPLKSNVG